MFTRAIPLLLLVAVFMVVPETFRTVTVAPVTGVPEEVLTRALTNSCT